MGYNPKYNVAGGIKLFFEEGFDGTKGYRDLGNLVSTGMETAVEKLEHYTSRSGQRQKDAENVIESGITINFAFDEPNEFNLRWAFLGGDMAQVNSGSQRITRELVQLDSTHAVRVALAMAVSPNVVIEAIEGSPTTYALTTDYTVNSGASTITRVGGGAIADGEYVMVSYDAQLPAHQSFPVMESPILEGRGRLLLMPTKGRYWWWEFSKCAIAPDGEFSLDQENWMQASMSLSILADTDNFPDAPFGTLRTWHMA